MALEDTPTEKADMRANAGVACSAEELDPEISVVLTEFQRLVGERSRFPDFHLCRGALRCSAPKQSLL